jgi:hypothetical protein
VHESKSGFLNSTYTTAGIVPSELIGLYKLVKTGYTFKAILAAMAFLMQELMFLSISSIGKKLKTNICIFS